ncbi:MAG: DUF1624 domain-containing protein [Candidatus Bathyarchaeia archaeon]
MKVAELSSEAVLRRSFPRLTFIDFARGVVMAIMAWDHVSGFWHELHHGGEGILGRAPPFASLTWFMERFVSHVCAPTFVFLAGTVLALSVAKRLDRGDSQWEVSFHLIKRGLVLLLLEAVVVAPVFDLPSIYFGVIACIGVCLIIFSVYRRLPPVVILAVSLIIILNHQYLRLDWIPTDTGLGWYLRVVIHEPNFDRWPFVGLYPIIPWLGVMGLGWFFGSLLATLESDRIAKLKLLLLATGIGSIIMFFVVRLFNGYGNLLRRWGGTVIDWLYVSKYPPSVAFLLWSLGLMCVLLSIGLFLQERGWSKSNVSGIIHVFGRNPLFFYLVHLWLYRMRLPGVIERPFYLEMWQTFIFWLVGLAVLWQLCARYEGLKRAHPRFLKYI